MTEWIFGAATAGMLIGVAYASLVPTNVAWALAVGCVGAALLGAVAFLKTSRKEILVAGLFLVAAALGMARYALHDAAQPKHLLDAFVGESVTVEGVITSEVENRERSQRIVLSAEVLEHAGTAYEVDSRLVVTTDFFPEFYYGDRIRATGKLKHPEAFTTEIGRTFDYESYLMKDGIFYTMSFAGIEFMSDGHGSWVKTRVLRIKQAFLSHIEALLPAPESGLLSGLLLGVKGSLGERLHQAFIDTGLVHIIVLSGYNVTIIAEAVIKSLSFLGAMAGVYAGGVFIFLFAIMTGGGATIVRASIMALLALMARATGRTYEASRALLIAATLMVIQNPYILVYDLSFQLSFLATLGLMYATPVFDKLFRKLPNVAALRDITSATFATQLTVLPFLLYKIGNLSVIAPVTNILVLPVVPMTMFYGFMAGTSSFISPVLGMPFGFIAFLLLKYEIFVVTLFAKLPFASFVINRFPLVAVLVCYTIIIWYLQRFHTRHERIPPQA